MLKRDRERQEEGEGARGGLEGSREGASRTQEEERKKIQTLLKLST